MNLPSTGRKIAFWLIAGILSVVFVEVPAGSTMFPFFTVWGLLVVWPLYLLHSVFLATVVFRFGKPNFWPLYAAGMLYGMYEAYIRQFAVRGELLPVWCGQLPGGRSGCVLVVVLFSLYVVVGLVLLAGAILYASEQTGSGLARNASRS